MAEDRQIIFSMYKVSKTYPPQKQVIKDISLSFYLGAKIGIIGLNGSGKSTLMKDYCRARERFQWRIKPFLRDIPLAICLRNRFLTRLKP